MSVTNKFYDTKMNQSKIWKVVQNSIENTTLENDRKLFKFTEFNVLIETKYHKSRSSRVYTKFLFI